MDRAGFITLLERQDWTEIVRQCAGAKGSFGDKVTLMAALEKYPGAEIVYVTLMKKCAEHLSTEEKEMLAERFRRTFGMEMTARPWYARPTFFPSESKKRHNAPEVCE